MYIVYIYDYIYIYTKIILPKVLNTYIHYTETVKSKNYPKIYK